MKLNEAQHSAEVISTEDQKLFKFQEQNVQQQFRNEFTFVSQIQHINHNCIWSRSFLLFGS